MPWPTPQDYQEAIQSPAVCFSDPELKSGTVEVDRLGLPRPISGGFAVVYKVRSGSHTWAVRCFQREVHDQQERYAAIDEHLRNAHLPYTVGFKYLPKGILVHGQWHPILKMEWVAGTSLVEFVQDQLSRTEVMQNLASRWLSMAQHLRQSSLAHGDLQHGNVLLVGGKLKLIDYDGMYVPALLGKTSTENGHRNYQHPDRKAANFGPSLDNFSHWLIYVSLVALSLDPSLWYALDAGDEHLLFRQEDFQFPNASAALALMERHSDARLRVLGLVLRNLWRFPFQSVPPVGEYVSLISPRQTATPIQSAKIGSGEWWRDHLPSSPVLIASPTFDPFASNRDESWLHDLSAPYLKPLSLSRKRDAESHIASLHTAWNAQDHKRKHLEQLFKDDVAPFAQERLLLTHKAQALQDQLHEAFAQELKTIASQRYWDEAKLRSKGAAVRRNLKRKLEMVEQDWGQAQIALEAQIEDLKAVRYAEIQRIRDMVNTEIARMNKEIRILTTTLNPTKYTRQVGDLQKKIEDMRATLKDRDPSNSLQEEEAILGRKAFAQAEYEQKRQELIAQIANYEVEFQRLLADNNIRFNEMNTRLSHNVDGAKQSQRLEGHRGLQAESIAQRYTQERVADIETRLNHEMEDLLRREAQVAERFSKELDKQRLETLNLREMIESTVYEPPPVERARADTDSFSYRHYLRALLLLERTQ